MNTPSAPPLPDELDTLLRRLRLPYLRKHAPEVIATAKAQRWDPTEVLRVRRRSRRPRRRDPRAAAQGRRVPSGKTLDGWDPDASSIPTPTQSALATLEWVHRAENLAVCGPSGTGKSHFVEALGHACIDAGMRVSWFTLETLTTASGRATTVQSPSQALASSTLAGLVRADLLRGCKAP